MSLLCRIALIAVLLCTPLINGCNGDGSLGPTAEDETTGGLVMPSVTRERGGHATAVGTLAYRRDLGGVFVLVDLTPGETPTTEAGVVAVLAESKGQTSGEDLGALVGSYCAFEGSIVETETTITVRAPRITVESYRILNIP